MTQTTTAPATPVSRRRRRRCTISRFLLAVSVLVLCAMAMPGCNTMAGVGEDMSAFGDGMSHLFDGDKNK